MACTIHGSYFIDGSISKYHGSTSLLKMASSNQELALFYGKFLTLNASMQFRFSVSKGLLLENLLQNLLQVVVRVTPT